jgi:DnaK suppressor protein
MRKAAIDRIKKLLLAQRQELMNKPRHDDEIDANGDDVDIIQGKILADTLKQLNLRETQKLKQIENALAKIQNKTFGDCEECGDPIAEKRLEYNPYFTLCFECAEEAEKVMKRVAR